MTKRPDHSADDRPPPPDHGLRRILTWTAIALAATLILAAIAVTLAVRAFDRG